MYFINIMEKNCFLLNFINNEYIKNIQKIMIKKFQLNV